MGLFQQIEMEAEKRHLKYLVIGGLAVNFHGYSRDTADLDLLIERVRPIFPGELKKSQVAAGDFS